MNDFDLTTIASILEAALKVFKETHWSTDNYWIHKQTDEIKEYISEAQDELAEIILGTDAFNNSTRAIVLAPEEFLGEFKMGQNIEEVLSTILHLLKDYYMELEALEASIDPIENEVHPVLFQGIKSALDDLIGKLQKSRYLCRMR